MKKCVKYMFLAVNIAIICSFFITFSCADTNDSDYSAENAGKENSWRYSDGEIITEDSSTLGRTSRAIAPSNAIAHGIDVSEHNGEINWTDVKQSGVDFVIIRCGYGMDNEKQDDAYWEYNVSECERLGIPYGVYLYSYADSVERASSEANHVLRLLKGHNPDYPVYYDLEESSLASTGNRQLLANMARTFCNKISSAGYKPGIYANLNWWNNYLTDSSFDNSGWDKWVAQYYSSCSYKKDFHIWQYSSKGKVSGISTYVDMNYEYGEKPRPNVISMKNGSATLTWNSIKGATKYAVASKESTGYKTYTLECKSTNYTVSGLENGKTYNFLVQAYINGKWTNFTDNDLVNCFFIESPNVKVKSTGDGSVTLSWDNVNGATKYAIAEYIDGGYKTYTLNCTQTTYTINNLANNYTHRFLVQANVNGKWSICSTDLLVNATPKGTIKPTVKAISKGNSSVSLSWDKVPGATKYAIATNEGKGYKTYTLTCTGTSYVVKGLTVGKRYGFLVQAYINGKWSRFTDADLVYATVVDTTIPNVKVKSTGDGNVTLSWDNVNGATKYAIAEYIDGGYKTYTLNCTQTTYTINNLANNCTHRFLVQANVNGKWSTYSTDLLVNVKL